jgi:ribosomal peptide maturation radical SAM protein 1
MRMPRFDFEAARRFFRGGDALLILPPFAGYERPSLGLHVLKAVAAEAGLKVDILYANTHFASAYGEERYTGVCYAPTGDLSGEKVFAPVAFPGAVGDFNDEETRDLTANWIGDLAAFLASLDYPVVGCNTMFEQLTCSIAILDALKSVRPDVVTIIGGAQCEGEMAEGILDLGKGIDYVFGGESESTFIDFLRSPQSRPPTGSAIHGTPLTDMERLPEPDFGCYFEQFAHFCPDSVVTKEGLHWLPLEGSRGCWWGQKHHCTFCGINGNGMAYRMKSGPRLADEIERQVISTGCRNLLMVDNIMPHQYFNDLLPTLRDKQLDLRIFYEQKANLTAPKMEAIGAAGINIIQPGIESLSDDLLLLMKKGVKSWQNVAALRHARMCDVHVNWNLLHSFPEDKKSYYEDMEKFVPKLQHLCPPSGLNKLAVDRFSPYFDQRERYGITNVRPMEAYRDIFPPDAPLAKLAYHFKGDYESDALNLPGTLDALGEMLDEWIAAWRGDKAPPILSITKLEEDLFLFMDTRKIATQTVTFGDRAAASAAVFGSHGGGSDALDWCLERDFCALIGGVVAPLAVPNVRLFHELSDDRLVERPQEELHSPERQYA